MRTLLLLRPEPGLSASAGRARGIGLEVVACPLFRVEAVGWEAPDSDEYDGLILTSANAIRHGGEQLKRLTSLPVHAVGSATAAAAREAGFHVATVGSSNLAGLLAALPPQLRLLHLAGEDHLNPGDARLDRRIVYRAAAIDDPGLPGLDAMVAAVHSPRAGARLAELAGNPGHIAIAAISHAAAEACGEGWERVEVAEKPDDNSLLALAARLCHTSPRR